MMKAIIRKSDITVNLIIYIILVIACILILIPSFGNGFFSDDYSWLIKAKESTGKNFGTIFFEPAPYEYFRPVPVIVFSAMWNFFEGGFIYYRILTLVLHILTTIFIYHLLLSTGFGRKVSALSALVFAVMACHSEALYSVYSINELLSALFVFSGLYVFLSEIKFRGVISAILFLLAVLSRESAFCFIPMIFLFNIKSKKQKFFEGLFISLFVTGLYTALRFISYMNYAELYAGGNSGVLQLNPLIIVYKVFHFIINMLIPVKSIFYVIGFEFYETLRNAIIEPGQNVLMFAVLVVVSGGIIVMTIFFLFKISRKIFLFPLLAAACGIIVYLPFEGTAERFLYLPSAGIALMIGLFCIELVNKKFKTAYFIIILIPVVYSLSIYQRAGMWKEASLMTKSSVEKIHLIIAGHSPVKNVLMQDVPTMINGVFFVNQYNFNHIWKYHFPDEKIRFMFSEKQENINPDLTLKFSDFAPYP
jgi:hypothetical protein